MIDTYLLEQVLAFYEAGTLSKAAENLLISQPALSQSMKKLEDLVGVPLFDRRRNKTTFNDNGLLLVEYAQKILDLQTEMIDRVRLKDRHRAEIHLASIAPVPLDVLEKAVHQHQLANTITTQLLSDEAAMLAALENGTYDLAITRTPVTKSGFIAQPFFKESLSMQVPNAHPLAKKEVITFDDLAGQNILIYSEIGSWMDMVKTKIPTANLLVMDNSEAFISIANMGEFPTFYSDIRETPDLKTRTIIPIDEPDCHVQFYLVMRAEDERRWGSLAED